MPEKVGFWKRLHSSRKMQWVFFCVSMFLIICIYVPTLKIVKDLARRNFQIVQNDFSWIFNMDSLSSENREISIRGWAYKLNENATASSYDVILHDLAKDEYFFPDMTYSERKDINEYYLCEYDYTDSGFEVSFSEDEISAENIYEILVKPHSTHVAYKSNTFLLDGELFYENPQEYVSLDVQDTALEDIVKNGILEVYRKDVGIYVYQHEGYLYWIADENYYFEEDGSTYVQYQLWTTQNDKLPLYRLENNWLFDNLGFTFETNEVQELSTSKYRVAKAAIPTEYAICKIETGYYVNNEWIWVNHFLPYSK